LHATLNLPPPIFTAPTTQPPAPRVSTRPPPKPSTRNPLPRPCRTILSYVSSRSHPHQTRPVQHSISEPTPFPPIVQASNPSNLSLIPALPSFYLKHLNQYSNTDTQHQDCHFRRTSTYIQHIWNGTIGKAHPAYVMCITAPRLHYTSWCRMRVLNIHLSMYTWYHAAFSLRRCPHCPHALSDLLHHVTSCSHSLAAVQSVYPSYTQPTLISDLFNPLSDLFLCMKYITILTAHAARHHPPEPVRLLVS
jgi:hypothetical protein